jgi:hypothetical protein
VRLFSFWEVFVAAFLCGPLVNSLEYFDLPIDQLHIRSIQFDPAYCMIQNLLGLSRSIGHTRNCNHRLLPTVLLIDLGGRHIEFSMQAGQQWFERGAFTL